MNIELMVPGVPEPKGSYHLANRGGKTWIIPGSNGKMAVRMQEWAFRVRTYAERTAKAHVLEPWDGPLAADVTFYMPRPPSAPKRRIHALTRPDLDKLLRGVFDPMKGVLFTDDSRLVQITARKVYSDAETPPGAWVRLWSV